MYYGNAFKIMASCASPLNTRFLMIWNVSLNKGCDTRKPDFVVCERLRRRSGCASTQSDQPLGYMLNGIRSPHATPQIFIF